MNMNGFLDQLINSGGVPTSQPSAATPSAPATAAPPKGLGGLAGFLSKIPIEAKVGIGYGNNAASFSTGGGNDRLLRKLLERQLGQGGGVTQNPQPQTPVYKYEPLKMDPMSMNMTPGLYNPLAIR